jgi:hypothetical protein
LGQISGRIAHPHPCLGPISYFPRAAHAACSWSALRTTVGWDPLVRSILLNRTQQNRAVLPPGISAHFTLSARPYAVWDPSVSYLLRAPPTPSHPRVDPIGQAGFRLPRAGVDCWVALTPRVMVPRLPAGIPITRRSRHSRVSTVFPFRCSLALCH